MDLETGPPAGGPATTEVEAWAMVVSGWTDEEAHRAYLARFTDLEGLSQAGRRYREALLRRPEDPVALRWRDEVVKRAAVQGLAQLPRSRAPREAPVWVRRALVGGMVLVALVLAGWLLATLSRLGGRR